MALTKVGRLIDKGVIKDQTNLGTQAADTDEYLLYDASADALKSIAASNVTPNETLITGKTELSVSDVATGDLLLIYDTSAGVLKKIQRGSLVALQPVVSSISPSNALSGDGSGNYTFTISGTDFDASTVKFIGNDATEYTPSSVTVDSSTTITAVIAKSTLPTNNEPYDVKVTNGNGLTNTNTDLFNIDAQPSWVTGAGSIGTISDAARSGYSVTVTATDPESGAITYALVSGALPGGLSLNTSTGVISGNASAVGSNTTSNFTIRAKDSASNATERAFSLTVNAPAVETFNSSGTFSVPSGVSAVNVLVVAGGGGGGYDVGGGGGAGGLVYRPGFSVTPGGTVTVTVGNGGSGGTSASGDPYFSNTNGQDSVFGTLTAKGGGGGGSGNGSGTHNPGRPGGSAGAGGWRSSPTGTALQPTQSGESGNYGFGNVAGQPSGPSHRVAGGGGGAGAAGDSAGPTDQAGDGGVGKAYTIADGTTSVYYAGGGAGGGQSSGQLGGTGGQGGGGNGAGNGQPNTYQPGTANRGGGGGGQRGSPFPASGGAGGKGIVIVSY